MLGISKFFEKLTRLHQDRILQHNNISEVIDKITGVKVPADLINIENGTVRLNLSPVLKNEIFMHRRAIIEGLADLGAKVRDIK